MTGLLLGMSLTRYVLVLHEMKKNTGGPPFPEEHQNSFTETSLESPACRCTKKAAMAQGGGQRGVQCGAGQPRIVDPCANEGTNCVLFFRHAMRDPPELQTKSMAYAGHVRLEAYCLASGMSDASLSASITARPFSAPLDCKRGDIGCLPALQRAKSQGFVSLPALFTEMPRSVRRP